MKSLQVVLRNVLFFCKKIATYISERPFVSSAFVFFFLFAISTLVYFSVTPLASGDDPLFHIRFAETLRTQGFFHSLTDFKSLYFSKMATGQYVIYYNFLFYLALIPFTFITPLYIAIKLYAVMSFSLAFTLFYSVLRKLGVKHSFLWTISIVGIFDSYSLWRFFISRPFTLAPAILVVFLYCLFKKKYAWVFVLSLVYFYWHSLSFFFPMCIAIGYAVSELFYTARIDWKKLSAAFLGTVVGVASSYLFVPGFLLYARDILFGIFWQGRTVFLPEGGEVFPINFFNFLDLNKIIFSMLVVATFVELYQYVFVLRRHGKKTDLTTIDPLLPLRSLSFFLSIAFFAAAIIVSGRFADYFIFFVGLYLVLSLTAIWKRISFSEQFLKRAIVASFVLVGCYLFTSNMILIQSHIGAGGAPAEEFQGIGGWLRDNTKPGDVVFNASWNWFTGLYYYSPLNNYTIGIEPRFIYSYDPAVYWLWLHISAQGYVCDQQLCPDVNTRAITMIQNPTSIKQWHHEQGEAIADTLLKTFHSEYVVSSYQFKLMNDVLNDSPRFEKVYGGDRIYYIYHVLPSKKIPQ